MFVAGMCMFLWANSLEIPTTFLEVNEYVLVSGQYFVTSQTSALFIGFSSRLLICTLLIYQLEKKLASK